MKPGTLHGPENAKHATEEEDGGDAEEQPGGLVLSRMVQAIS